MNSLHANVYPNEKSTENRKSTQVKSLPKMKGPPKWKVHWKWKFNPKKKSTQTKKKVHPQNTTKSCEKINCILKSCNRNFGINGVP